MVSNKTVEQLEQEQARITAQLREAKQSDSFKGLVEAVKSGEKERITQACYVFLAHNRKPRGKDTKPRVATENQS